jgi:heat shock protein HtpX
VAETFQNQIAANRRNSFLLTLLVVILFALLGFAIGYAISGDVVGAFVAMGIALTAGVLIGAGSYFSGDSLVLAASGAKAVDESSAPQLMNVVREMAVAANVPMPKVYVIDDTAPNAFATGRDPEHAVVAATTGLLEIMDDQELEGVMAHEMGHVKNYDIRVSLIVFGLVIAIGLIADIIFRLIFWGGRSRNSNLGGPAFLIVIAIGLVAAILAPIVAAVVQAAVSRQREYLADATSSLTTRNPEALASALEKLGANARPVARTNTSMSHLWIADPNRPGFLARMFSTHPPIVDRVARLRNNATKF